MTSGLTKEEQAKFAEWLSSEDAEEWEQCWLEGVVESEEFVAEMHKRWLNEQALDDFEHTEWLKTYKQEA